MKKITVKPTQPVRNTSVCYASLRVIGYSQMALSSALFGIECLGLKVKVKPKELLHSAN